MTQENKQQIKILIKAILELRIAAQEVESGRAINDQLLQPEIVYIGRRAMLNSIQNDLVIKEANLDKLLDSAEPPRSV